MFINVYINGILNGPCIKYRVFLSAVHAPSLCTQIILRAGQRARFWLILKQKTFDMPLTYDILRVFRCIYSIILYNIRHV